MKEMSAPTRAARHQQWLEQVDAALRTSGLESAARLALQALAEGIEDPALLNLAASVRYGEGRFQEAVELLRSAHVLAPNDPNVLNSLGVCLRATGQMDDALHAFDEALKIDPDMAAAHFNRGTALEDHSDMNGARSAYERATALDPNYVDAGASLAWVDAELGNAASARVQGESVLANSPSNILARMAVAAADLQQGNLETASARLSALLQDPALTRLNRAIVAGLIGDLRDAERRPGEAFAAYQACNAELKAMNDAKFGAPGKETALGLVQRLTAWFEASIPEPWRQAPLPDPQSGDSRTHVFLVGFPRSGTTLLENVLAAHPKIVSLEEKDLLGSAEAEYLTSDEGLERLARLNSEDAERQRNRYWSAVRSFGVEPGGQVFIDKMPLASVQLPLIAKIFPNARILFARRDPRDVVLSCFRRRFAMNPSMYQLLTLDGAAAHYDAVMRLSELYRDLFPLPQHVVRYENLVDDFEETARAACEFLGLEWDSGLFDFAGKARARGIATPSAAQVVRGLNREGQGTWRRYRDQMTPVLPVLDPWVHQFGYASE